MTDPIHWMTCRIVSEFDNRIYFAREVRDDPENSERLLVDTYTDGRMRPYKRNIQVTPIGESEAIFDFEEGGQAIVTKYGGNYQGEIVKVGRTRISVEIKLRSGKYKVVTVPALEAQVPSDR